MVTIILYYLCGLCWTKIRYKELFKGVYEYMDSYVDFTEEYRNKCAKITILWLSPITWPLDFIETMVALFREKPWRD